MPTGFTTWPDYEGLDAPLEVRTHARARRLTLRIRRHPRAVIVTLPADGDLCEADAFIMRNIDWVREGLSRIPKPVPFHDGALMPLRGVIHRLVFTRSQTGVVVQRAANIDDVRGSEGMTQHRATNIDDVSRNEFEENQQIIEEGRETGVVVQRAADIGDVCDSGVEGNQGVPELHVGGPVEHAPQRLLDYLYEEVWWDLYVSIIKHAQRLNVTAPHITICDPSTRWASCSTTGPLSFSWRLVLAPPFVLDYVVAHEVAHLVEMNHSPKFWALVENMMPRMEEAKDWLDVEGADLHRYGPVKARRKGK